MYRYQKTVKTRAPGPHFRGIEYYHIHTCENWYLVSCDNHGTLIATLLKIMVGKTDLSLLVRLLYHYLTPAVCAYILSCICEYRLHPVLHWQKHQSFLYLCKKWGGHGPLPALPFWGPGELGTTNYPPHGFPMNVAYGQPIKWKKLVAVFQSESRMTLRNKDDLLSMQHNAIFMTVDSYPDGYTRLDELRSSQKKHFSVQGWRSLVTSLLVGHQFI